MSGEEKPNEQKKPLTTEELLAKLAADSYENRRAINAVAEAMVKLKQDIDSLKGGGGTGGAGAPQPDTVAGLLKAFGLVEEKGSMEGFVKQAENMAKLADALIRYRNPVLPYSPADRFLMRAGAMAVRRTIMYEGVKKKSERAEEEVSMREIDKELGFAGEEEEGEETEHVK